jgi:hypothetical protein
MYMKEMLDVSSILVNECTEFRIWIHLPRFGVDGLKA